MYFLKYKNIAEDENNRSTNNNPFFIVHTSLYSVLVNIIRDACFYGYTALPNYYYLVNNVFNFNVFFTIAGFFYSYT